MRSFLIPLLAGATLLGGCTEMASNSARVDAAAPLAARVELQAKKIISPRMESLLDDREESALAEAVQRAATSVTNGAVNWVATVPDASESTANGRIVPHAEPAANGNRTCRQLLLKTWKGAQNPVDDQLTVCRPTEASAAGTVWMRDAG